MEEQPRDKAPDDQGPLPDRYDNDLPNDGPAERAGHDEYRERLERSWKHAAWRTEMAQRLRASGRSPSRPDIAI